MNRATYWLCLGIVIAAVAVMGAAGIRPPRVGEAMLVIMCVPRLHDLGRSGWWVAIPIAVEAIAIILAIAVLSPEEASIVFGAVFLAVMGFIVVLGAIPGEPHANRFGDPPSTPFAFRERARVAKTEEIFK